VSRSAEHQTLIPGALAIQRIGTALGTLLEGVVDALRDVG
jgi:hypothetical protein